MWLDSIYRGAACLGASPVVGFSYSLLIVGSGGLFLRIALASAAKNQDQVKENNATLLLVAARRRLIPACACWFLALVFLSASVIASGGFRCGAAPSGLATLWMTLFLADLVIFVPLCVRVAISYSSAKKIGTVG